MLALLTQSDTLYQIGRAFLIIVLPPAIGWAIGGLLKRAEEDD